MGKIRDLFKKIRNTKRPFHDEYRQVRLPLKLELCPAVPQNQGSSLYCWAVECSGEVPQEQRSMADGQEAFGQTVFSIQYTRRYKKAFLRDQCKEIEENNRMGKIRDLFKKIRDTKGTFHAKMGMIKDRNGMDLTEAEDIKKRCQEYTEELYKKRS